MKQIFTLIFVLFAAVMVQAQNFTMTPLSETKSLDGTNEVIMDASITNNTSDTIFFSWERTLTRLPEGWISLVCDANQCYGPSTNSANFYILANQTKPFSVHVTPSAADDYAIIDIKLFEVDHVDQAVNGTYQFGVPLANEAVTAAKLSIYPNPATSYFQVKNGQKVASIEIINILGVKVIETDQTHTVDIAELKQGMYFVRLLDGSNKVIATQRIQKN